MADEEYVQTYPHGFPEIEYPKDNHPTVSRVELGRRLFFDPILSKDSSISCSSCHLPEFAFADTLAISNGINGPLGFRNAYSLMNVAYQEDLHMEGGIPRLELQVLAPLGESSEQDISLNEAAERAKRISSYRKLAKRAYDREMDPYVITRAITAYERTLIAGNSKWDEYKQGDANAMNLQEVAGSEIFFGKGNCSSCHTGFLFSDQGFYNIGLYNHYEDLGKQRLSDNPNDNGKFKVPSLRNVSLTAPYMHNGSINTLEEVINHFNSGGKGHPVKSELIIPLGLTEEEKEQLMAFLMALEDIEVTGNTIR